MIENFERGVIGVGVQKGGTTFTHALLSKQINSSNLLKEFNFFSSSDYAKGSDWYLKRYLQDNVILDFSPSYFTSSDARKRISNFSADYKKVPFTLVICLRNPIDRIISNIKHELMRGRLSEDDIINWRRNRWILENSNYAYHINKWLELKIPIYLIKFESLNNPQLMTIAVKEILGKQIILSRIDLLRISEWGQNKSILGLRGGIYQTLRSIRKFLGPLGLPKHSFSKTKTGKIILNQIIDHNILFPNFEPIKKELKKLLSEDVIFYDKIVEGWITNKNI